ncbi:RNase J family beta-CASP ribonuclease [Candidatus Pacearchaeota archaeon]|nr:RNase J family beta-CASP ribonuclease [Candidatus Pacearchaeota archaeon]
MIEVCTVGGYEEVGKNMTAIKIGEDVIIIDAGVFLPPLMDLQESENQGRNTEKKMRKIKALPDDKVLDEIGWRDKVRAIIISHAHLDHIGAIPYIAHRYPNTPIYGTPFTLSVLERILEDEKMTLKNPLKKIKPDTSFTVKGKSGNHKVDFIHVTHSTLQVVFPVIHTKDGAIVYTLDFKFDNFPTMGKAPNYKKMKQIAKKGKGVKLMIVDSLYSGEDKKTPSERIARNLLEDAFSVAKHDRKSALFVTTFSSHIERLKSVVEFGKKTGRQIIIMGRSMNKYINAARKANLDPFRSKIKLLKYRRQINAMLKKVNKNRGKYLILCTGHQAEKGSIMDRIVGGETPFKFKKGDNVVFASSVIPTPASILNRDKMDKRLRNKGVRVQTDIHVSGHASGDDLRELLKIFNPEHIIPAHGSLQQETPMIEIGNEFGYNFGETSHLSSDGKVLTFK